MIVKIKIPDYVIRQFDITASCENITTDKVIETALMTFYNIGFLSEKDQETIIKIINNENN